MLDVSPSANVKSDSTLSIGWNSSNSCEDISLELSAGTCRVLVLTRGGSMAEDEVCDKLNGTFKFIDRRFARD